MPVRLFPIIRSESAWDWPIILSRVTPHIPEKLWWDGLCRADGTGAVWSLNRAKSSSMGSMSKCSIYCSHGVNAFTTPQMSPYEGLGHILSMCLTFAGPRSPARQGVGMAMVFARSVFNVEIKRLSQVMKCSTTRGCLKLQSTSRSLMDCVQRLGRVGINPFNHFAIFLLLLLQHSLCTCVTCIRREEKWPLPRTR